MHDLNRRLSIGSTMDAMSDAIEGADVMLYGVSLAYKESANVRLASRGVVQQLIGPCAFTEIA